MTIFTFLLFYFLFNIFLALLIWFFVPEKAQSGSIYFIMMIAFGILVVFLLLLITVLLMFISLIHTDKKGEFSN